jgi:hypothetical protein
MTRRGPYASRVRKIVARLKVRYPTLTESFLEEVVRQSFIGDISDSQFFHESVHHVEFQLANPGIRENWFLAYSRPIVPPIVRVRKAEKTL